MDLCGVTAFDLVFLDHWKDRYLPDTKLMEASPAMLVKRLTFQNILIKYCFFLTPVLGLWPSEERQHPAG